MKMTCDKDEIVNHRYSADEKNLAIYFTRVTFGLITDTHEAPVQTRGSLVRMSVSYTDDGRIVMLEFIDVCECAAISQQYDTHRDELSVFFRPPNRLIGLQQTFDPAIFVSCHNGVLNGLLIKDASKTVVVSVSDEERDQLDIRAIDWNTRAVDQIKAKSSLDIGIACRQ
jgi:hypothetical protein